MEGRRAEAKLAPSGEPAGSACAIGLFRQRQEVCETMADDRAAGPKIDVDIRDSEPDRAPNVLLLAWDDIGYGTMDVFGGPVETPNMRRIAEMGVRYANFHTTALCSPTRSSLLTGRNATSNGMATIAEFSSGFPGISTRIPFENGFISEALGERAYGRVAVAAVGAHREGPAGKVHELIGELQGLFGLRQAREFYSLPLPRPGVGIEAVTPPLFSGGPIA